MSDSISKWFAIFLMVIFFFGCKSKNSPQKIDDSFEILDDEAYKIFSTSAQLKTLASGHIWTEGPLWLDKTKQLIFNDIPANTTFSWSEAEGTNVYLKPSGYTSESARGGEPGANGLILDSDGALVLCQH